MANSSVDTSIKEETDEERSTSHQPSVKEDVVDENSVANNQSTHEEIGYDTSFITSSVNSSINAEPDSEIASTEHANPQSPAADGGDSSEPAFVLSPVDPEQPARNTSACQFRADKAWLDCQFHDEDKTEIKKPDELENEMVDPPKEDSTDSIRDRIQGSIFGMTIGDALGAHVEFRPREFLVQQPVEDLQGGGTWGLAAGQFTDDTSMALCLANSLLARTDFSPYDQLVRYKWWYRNGYMSSTGKCFDIGAATRQSIEEFEQRQKTFAEQNQLPEERMDYLSDDDLLKKFDVFCSADGVAGNGALMRLTPVPLFFYAHPKQAVLYSGLSGKITHGDVKAYDACRYYGALIVAALHGEAKEQLLDPEFYERHKDWFNDEDLHKDVMDIAQGSFKKANGYEDGIRGKGYIINALEAALWAFWVDEGSFRKGVLAAVNLGDDTDTTAAIYGQLAGAYYGYDKLPFEWIEKIYANKFLVTLSKWLAYEGHRWASSTQSNLTLEQQLSHSAEKSVASEAAKTPELRITSRSSTSSGSSSEESKSSTDERDASSAESRSSAQLFSADSQPQASSATVKPPAEKLQASTSEPVPSPSASDQSFDEPELSQQSASITLPVEEPQTTAQVLPSPASSNQPSEEIEPATKDTQPSSTTSNVESEEADSTPQERPSTPTPLNQPSTELRPLSTSPDLSFEEPQLLTSEAQTSSASVTLPSEQSESSKQDPPVMSTSLNRSSEESHRSISVNIPSKASETSAKESSPSSTSVNLSWQEPRPPKPEPPVSPITTYLRSEQTDSSRQDSLLSSANITVRSEQYLPSWSAVSSRHSEERETPSQVPIFRSERSPPSAPDYTSRREEPRPSTGPFKQQSPSPSREENPYSYPISLPVYYDDTIRKETYHESSTTRHVRPTPSSNQSNTVHYGNELRFGRQQDSYINGGGFSSNSFRNVPSASKPLYQGKNLAKWTNSDVCHWIESLGMNFKSYADRFRKEGTDGYGLFAYVGRKTLSDFGVHNEEHQKTVLDGIQMLKNRLSTSY